MKYTEELHWILDNGKLTNEDKYRQNIEFVHSLGLKCDCVGWSKLILSDHRTDEILDAIDSFCKKNGFKARCVYTRRYTDFESEWYEFDPTTSFNRNTIDSFFTCKSEQGNSIKLLNIKAYHEMKSTPKRIGSDKIFVPERFRNTCLSHNIKDIDFCWVNDKGKYEAEQYFYIYGNNQIPNIIDFYHSEFGLKTTFLKKLKQKQVRRKMNKMDGYIPKIAKIFHTLQQINLPNCYFENDMPNCKIAQAHTLRTYSHDGRRYAETYRNKFLIHKSFVEVLLKENVISESALQPALIVKEIPEGYTVNKTERINRPTFEYMNQSIKEYEKIKTLSRPKHKVTESEALKIFRNAKKEKKEDFKKSLPKASILTLNETKYAPLIPFYLIANGCYLSDEYEFLSYDKAFTENNLFVKELNKEELLAEKPKGIVIATCPDGDRIMLCDNGEVIRFSHEDLTIIEEWQNLPLFIVDAINN